MCNVMIDKMISSSIKLLLISNSTNVGEAYLAYPQAQIGDFLQGITRVAFVPYAAVTFSYEAYEAKVQERFSALGIEVCSVHRADNPAEALAEAPAIVVGGGNTFHLLKRMQEEGLIEVIRRRVREGIRMWVGARGVMSPVRPSEPPTICRSSNRGRSRRQD